ncbi:YraN family protein [Abyssalbus ytuae]|uniref:UPF0102 protein MQE35_10280 n=1 Tax=Abyssalbus ytuae TaxID=2926907 RepID=A0A9E6ZL49_9FLAO|nr:YraN family protein [Abyssalbus ytuae]UOB16125.1 YraN family protein [Abyssalbus ytuae]
MAQHNEFGKQAEQIAVDFLLTKKYDILERNYRFQKAEIDIIAKKDNTLVVVEVKGRQENFLERPEDSVNKKKIGLLVKAINEYIIKSELDMEVRFDIISVIKNKQVFDIEHFENAFYHF